MLSIFCFLLLAIILRLAYSWIKNYQRARKVGYEVRFGFPFRYVLPARKLMGPFQGNYPTYWTVDRFKEERSNCCVVFVNDLLIYVNEVQDVAEILSRPDEFSKPIKQYALLDIFGPSIISSEGEVFKVHKRVTARPFADKRNEIAFDESLRHIRGMLRSWEDLTVGNEIVVEDMYAECRKFAISVIASAGFGQEYSWASQSSTENIPKGHKISFHESISTVLERILVPVACSDFVMRNAPISWIREAAEAYQELRDYFSEMIECVSEEIKSGKSDSKNDNLLRALLRYQIGEVNEAGKDNLMGNIFFFFLAGHETTANALIFSMCLLVLHEEEQDRLYNEICLAIGDRSPCYQDIPHLTFVLFVMFETLRLFPPVPYIPKVPTSELKIGTGLLSPGTSVHIDVVRVHRRAEIYPDPHAFKPSRWDGRADNDNYEKRDRDAICIPGSGIRMPPYGAFLGFSAGRRACIGRKFAQMEYIAAMTVIIQNYEIRCGAGWTKERLAKAMEDNIGPITIRPNQEIQFRLIPRQKA